MVESIIFPLIVLANRGFINSPLQEYQPDRLEPVSKKQSEIKFP